MAAPATDLTLPAKVATRKPRSLWSDAWYQFRRHKPAMIGLFVLGFLVLTTLLGPLVYTTPTDSIDFAAGLEGPSVTHPFGTDDLGRDLLARSLVGGRVSIAVGVTAVLIAIVLGTLVGSIAGFFQKADNPLMRITDLFLSLPALPLLLITIFLFRDVLRQTFGPEAGIFIMIVSVIGVLNWMPVARLVRAQFLSLKRREFVEAARTVGAPNSRIIIKHILPNVLSPVVVAATIGVGGAILTESTLSFLGLGFPPDVPTWGRLLYDAQNYIDLAPHWVIFPGALIFVTVLSINYMGDGLRDALDPRRTAG
ncbi:MAG TPA: ABC transporter permease [Candidatus Limnocylindria bacterium]|jgi:peptide/nickel transport system permease protein|nr:ABC transporter permease [Candidatus Limnocylindria bacterium]